MLNRVLLSLFTSLNEGWTSYPRLSEYDVGHFNGPFDLGSRVCACGRVRVCVCVCARVCACLGVAELVGEFLHVCLSV